jgi:tRNA pseudouridine-54 N-methylase
MRQFIKVRHTAATSGTCSLDYAPSWTGLTDILVRCVVAASLTPFNMRRARLLPPVAEQDPQKGRVEDPKLTHLYPDERDGSLIRKIRKPVRARCLTEVESSPKRGYAPYRSVQSTSPTN